MTINLGSWQPEKMRGLADSSAKIVLLYQAWFAVTGPPMPVISLAVVGLSVTKVVNGYSRC
jgi:hypothetical protein